MVLSELIASLVIISLIVYYCLTLNVNFWSSRGVKGPKPVLIFGTTKDVILGRQSMAEYSKSVYRSYSNDPYVGIFTNTKPILMIRDLELIKHVLIKDFSMFSYRGIDIAVRAEPLMQHLLFLKTDRWRPLRQKLSGLFSSCKLKHMIYLVDDCGKSLITFLDNFVKKNPVIECRELSAKFTTDVIGVCAFGLNMQSITEQDSDFRKIANKIFEDSPLNFLRSYLRFNAPWLLDALHPIFYDRKLNEFFLNSIVHTMEHRKTNNIVRHDFIDLFISMKEESEKLNDEQYRRDMSDISIASQAFIFFIAGLETSSTTMGHALYELALNPTIQEQLHEEIVEGLKSSETGELTYDIIKDMTLLNKVFLETLRKYPPIAILRRASVAPYTLPGTKVMLPTNTMVCVPVYGIHHDPQYYPEPQKFDPERFSDENIKQRHPCVYLPFGLGPRNCIASRFGDYQSKVGLIHILKNYRVEVCDKTRIPYMSNTKSILLTPMDGINLKFSKI